MESDLKYLIFFYVLCVSTNAFSQGEIVDGGFLYLFRSDFETHRAEFNSAIDCEFIARTMNATDSKEVWHCSTSKAPPKFKCSLTGVTIINSEKNTKETLSLNFTISLTKGKANTTLASGISSFNYVESGNIIKFTNDSQDVHSNYFSRAVTYITIDLDTSLSRVLNFYLQENGSGSCEIITK